MIGKFKREFASEAVVEAVVYDPDSLRGQTILRCLPRYPDK
jgi:hypothetical protein